MTFFFALHLICSPEKICGRDSSSPMLKIGQNWNKIANYPPPPNAQQRFAPLLLASGKSYLNYCKTEIHS